MSICSFNWSYVTIATRPRKNTIEYLVSSSWFVILQTEQKCPTFFVYPALHPVQVSGCTTWRTSCLRSHNIDCSLFTDWCFHINSSWPSTLLPIKGSLPSFLSNSIKHATIPQCLNKLRLNFECTRIVPWEMVIVSRPGITKIPGTYLS